MADLDALANFAAKMAEAGATVTLDTSAGTQVLSTDAPDPDADSECACGGGEGQLWQECDGRGCEAEPVCARCFRCFRCC